jgi:hypothetical protein
MVDYRRSIMFFALGSPQGGLGGFPGEADIRGSISDHHAHHHRPSVIFRESSFDLFQIFGGWNEIVVEERDDFEAAKGPCESGVALRSQSLRTENE